MASRRALNAVWRSKIRCTLDLAHSKRTVAASYQAFERSMLQNGEAIARPSCGVVSSNHFSIVPWFQQRAGISVAGEGADSHDDFKPVQKDSSTAPSVTEHIEQDIKENEVMVYMKGVPEAPQCGFSAMVVRILDEYGVEYKTRDVLADPELRSAIKDYSKWPTIPQVYVNGEFVGGSDILISMHRSGELKTLLKDVKKDPSLP